MILLLDTATERGLLAVGDPGSGEILLETEFPADKQASAEIFRALDTARPYLADVEWVVVGLGPGSYSGIRVAICAALGVALPHGLKLGGVCSLAGIDPGELAEGQTFQVIGDARRQTYFLAEFIADGTLQGEIQLLAEPELRTVLESPQAISPARFAWDPRAAQVYDLPQAWPTAHRLLHLATNPAAPLQSCTILEPLYLRDPHITIPTRNRPLFDAAE